jgi:hypothetical protein
MWNKLMAINSFFLWPATCVFLIYTAGRGLVTGEWKLFVVALVVFTIFTIAEIVLGIMSD